MRPYAGIIIIIGMALCAASLGYWTKHRRWVKRTRAIVFHNLDAAKRNDFFSPDVYSSLHGLGAEDIAEDMLVCAPDVEDYEARQLVPYVLEWLQANFTKGDFHEHQRI